MLAGLKAFAAEAAEVIDWRVTGRIAAFTTAALLLWFRFMCAYFLNSRKDPFPLSEKRKAWFLSFLVSTCSTPIGVAYALRILSPRGWDPAELLERDALSEAVLTMFLTYLIVDMALGFREYRSEFGVLSGWVHHIFYSGFLSHALVKGYTVSFAFTLLMESSSILLSGGRLFPVLRRDLLFGLLFFAFRLVYHAFLLWKIYTIPNPRVVMWPPVLGVLILHVYWFYGWVEQQRRRRRKQKAGEPLTPSSLASPPAFAPPPPPNGHGHGHGHGHGGGGRGGKEE